MAFLLWHIMKCNNKAKGAAIASLSLPSGQIQPLDIDQAKLPASTPLQATQSLYTTCQSQEMPPKAPIPAQVPTITTPTSGCYCCGPKNFGAEYANHIMKCNNNCNDTPTNHCIAHQSHKSLRPNRHM
jgi:hypothetical protein